jgi:uncharacterized protein (TIGR02186 family)
LGKEDLVILNRKGKVLGSIWMNVGQVEIENVPDLYVLATSSVLGEMAGPADLERLGVGYAALGRQAVLKGLEGEEGRLFGEFVRLKERDGLFAVSENAIEMESGEGGMVRVTTDIRLPSRVPMGEHRILVHGFAAGAGVLLGTAQVRVTQVGMAASITNLATQHGLLYGILAVVVAILVGLLTGVVFGLGSKKAH